MKQGLRIFILVCLSIAARAQQPYKINPLNGLPYTDVNNNPIRLDKNYIPLPTVEEQFVDPISTKTKFDYGTNVWNNDPKDPKKVHMAYYVMEESNDDNCHYAGGCICRNGYFFGTGPGYVLQYPVAHINSPISTLPSPVPTAITLRTQKYSKDYIKAWWKDANCSWNKINHDFSYTTGKLQSKNAYKYGYYEARFKVNRPADLIANKGIGQCFWMFPDYNSTDNKAPNLPKNFVQQYCYSEIDIAEIQADRGVQGFGAIASRVDNTENCALHREEYDVTTECGCEKCGPDFKSIFHPYIQQEEFHTYALEWTPQSLKYFYDNRLIHTINNIGDLGKTPENFDPMKIIFDIEAADDDHSYYSRCEKVQPETQFPFNFEIDYFKQYKLDLVHCNLPLTILSQKDFDLFAISPKVRREITIGKNACTACPIISAPFGENVSIRASQYIELNDGFEVPIEAEFFADVIGECDYGY